MFKKIIDFYKVSEPIPAKASTPEENEKKTETSAMGYFPFCYHRIWYILCVPTQPERNQKTDCR